MLQQQQRNRSRRKQRQDETQFTTNIVLEPSFSGQLQCSLSSDTVPASTYSDKFLVDSRSLQASSDPLTPGSHAAACCTTNAAASSSSFYPSGWQAMQLNVAENVFQKGPAVAVPSSGGTSANELLTERSSSESNSGDSSSPSAGAATAAAAAAGNMRMKENVKTLSGSTEPAASKQDYVHVRARRGQATDSHSLAERVRREKISERMKYLQELVPGCSKVTGKAVMLDEIINYVQSLQQQVEILSMKLAAVNPQLDFNLDSSLKKEILQSGVSSVLGSELTSTFGLQLPLLTSRLAAAAPDFQSPLGTMDSHLCRTISAPTSIPFVPNFDAYGDDDATQMSIGWDREMQSMLHMGFGQTGQATSSSLLEGFNNCHMKVEL
ncbi:unnamed protein product [Sphagnum jensenii]|uniref:BHLH domain-containing protein n=1 Tax=Sphagnum jensenii TaxID=128206 RepID=A0ABP1BZ86_9BRYO